MTGVEVVTIRIGCSDRDYMVAAGCRQVFFQEHTPRGYRVLVFDDTGDRDANNRRVFRFTELRQEAA